MARKRRAHRPESGVPTARDLLEHVHVLDGVTRHRVLIATELIDDIGRLDDTLKASKKRVADAVTASGSTLVDIAGVGPICAAMIIGYTGDIGRSPTRGHFATYDATAPSEASSGPKARHRLNPRGGEGHARAGTRSKFGPATFGPRWFFSWGA